MHFARCTQQYGTGNEEMNQLTVLAAGSLREALTGIGAAYRNNTGTDVAIACRPSGKLREEIEHDGPADVFVSAALQHTEALAAKGILADQPFSPTTCYASSVVVGPKLD